jgi:hypothetical protein
MKTTTRTTKAVTLRTSPKDVFLHLLMMVMLYIGVISLISLAFAYINYTFPDPLDYYRTGILDNIRIQSSMLVVSFPLLLILSHFIQRDFRKTPAKHELRFSKWLVYLTLFVAALTIVIDLIQLVNKFYGGDLTTPFLLKVLSVLVVTGAVFGYYIWDVQSDPHKSNIPKIVAWISSFAVIGMLVLGFFIAGSPSSQRLVRMDDRRVNDLQMIQGEVINYWQLKRDLPQSLDNLKNDIKGFQPSVDPETGVAYEYQVIEPLKFSLCATFDKESLKENVGYAGKTVPISAPYGYPDQSADVWTHGVGKKCFERTIDPQLYPKL